MLLYRYTFFIKLVNIFFTIKVKLHMLITVNTNDIK